MSHNAAFHLGLQDFLIQGSNLQRGLDLLIVPDNLLYFPDFILKILSENGLSLSQKGFQQTL